ncbi:MAG: hypothetical protein V5B78_06195 [Desulfohalobiaceae bacterium]
MAYRTTRSDKMGKLAREDLVLTTPVFPATEVMDLAGEMAGRLGIPFHPRRKDTINRIVRRCGAKAALVAGSNAICVVHESREYSFHPNMALHRAHALKIGKEDRLVQAAGL